MKIKNVNLEWYVLEWDSNKKKVVSRNILKGLEESIAREVRTKSIYDKSILKEYLKTEFMYHYWCKCEWEFYISDLFGNNHEKVDIWRQIEPNLNLIVDYVNDKMKLNFK